jgi:hypothetical protein
MGKIHDAKKQKEVYILYTKKPLLDVDIKVGSCG